MEIIKSCEDPKNYTYLTLKNNLKCLLIEDKDTEKSACAMDVYVGSLDEPEDSPGIAHFLEHMLFMGTSKHPKQNDFSEFLAKHGSEEDNAYTDNQNTNYYFDCDHKGKNFKSGLIQALSRFSEFFISPLLDESCVSKEINVKTFSNTTVSVYKSKFQLYLEVINFQREICQFIRKQRKFIYMIFSLSFNKLAISKEKLKTSKYNQNLDLQTDTAINSEFEMGLTHTGTRQNQLFCNAALKNHPYSQFKCGNYHSLQQENLYEKLQSFYKKMYSSSIQKLVVYTNKITKKLLQTIELFSEIEYKPVEKVQLPYPYPKENCQKLWKIVPCKDKNKMLLQWTIPYDGSLYRIKPYYYMVMLLNHEGEKSLQKKLIQLNLAIKLACSCKQETDQFALFQITIKLTPLGMEHYEQVCGYVFEFIQLIKQQKIDQNFLEDYIQIEKNEFRFKEKQVPQDIASELSHNMQVYDVQDVLQGDYLLTFDEKQIIKFQNQITHENMFITFVSQKFKEECTQEEYYYKTQYKEEKIPTSIISLFYPTEFKSGFELPLRNPFIPRNFSLFENKKKLNEFPYKLYEQDNIICWHKQDNKFKTPKIYADLKFIFKDEMLENNCRRYQLANLFIALLNESIDNLLYEGREAGFSIVIQIIQKGLCVKLYGYQNPHQSLFLTLLQKVLEKKFDENKFKVIYEQKQIEIQNFLKQEPSQIILNMQQQLLRMNGKYDYYQFEQSIKNISVQDIHDFLPTFLTSFQLEMQLYGNIDQEQAMDYVQKVRSVCQGKINAQPNLQKQFCVKLDKHYFYELKLHQEDKNSAYLCYWQTGKETQRNRVLNKLLTSMMFQDFYDTLRTTEQLAYSLQCFEQEIRGVQGFCTTILSSVQDPTYLSQRVEEFLKAQLKKIEAFTEEEYKDEVDSLITILTQKEVTLHEQGEMYEEEIYKNTLNFNRSKIFMLEEIDRNICLQITQKEFIQHYKETFESQRLELYIVNTNHHEVYQKAHKPLTQMDFDTKKSLQLFEDFYLS